jgi:hypothetical protein
MSKLVVGTARERMGILSEGKGTGRKGSDVASCPSASMCSIFITFAHAHGAEPAVLAAAAATACHACGNKTSPRRSARGSRAARRPEGNRPHRPEAGVRGRELEHRGRHDHRQRPHILSSTLASIQTHREHRIKIMTGQKFQISRKMPESEENIYRQFQEERHGGDEQSQQPVHVQAFTPTVNVIPVATIQPQYVQYGAVSCIPVQPSSPQNIHTPAREALAAGFEASSGR